MSIETEIQWCDSSLNTMMGCQGCELWNPAAGIRRCYAGQLTARFGGKKGWPEKFELPVIFPERIAYINKWPDLTGKDRPHKPWLNKLPRTIFLNDQGDTFTEGLPIDWLTPFMLPLASSKHIYIVLTKRPHRMAEFFNEVGVPDNFWLCTSITNKASLARLPHLLTIKNAPILGLSIEPLWEDVADEMAKVPGIERIAWVKIGGEAGSAGKPCDLQWIRNLVAMFRKVNPACAVFVKQTGTYVFDQGVKFKHEDWHGGEWEEWPHELRVREMPWLALVA